MNNKRMTIQQMVINRIKAHLSEDAQKCAEYDIAGEDYTNERYFEIIRSLSHLSNQELKNYISKKGMG